MTDDMTKLAEADELDEIMARQARVLVDELRAHAAEHDIDISAHAASMIETLLDRRAAFTAAAAKAGKPGYVLVPAEPTKEMYLAGALAMMRPDGSGKLIDQPIAALAVYCYRAAIRALASNPGTEP